MKSPSTLTSRLSSTVSRSPSALKAPAHLNSRSEQNVKISSLSVPSSISIEIALVLFSQIRPSDRTTLKEDASGTDGVLFKGFSGLDNDWNALLISFFNSESEMKSSDPPRDGLEEGIDEGLAEVVGLNEGSTDGD